MRLNIYRLRAFKPGQKDRFRDFDFEWRGEKYEKAKRRLRGRGYRVQECFAWNK